MQGKSSSTSAMAFFPITTVAVLWWCLAHISGVSCLAPQARQPTLTGFSAESILDDVSDSDNELDGSNSENELPEVSPYVFAEGGSKSARDGLCGACLCARFVSLLFFIIMHQTAALVSSVAVLE